MKRRDNRDSCPENDSQGRATIRITSTRADGPSISPPKRIFWTVFSFVVLFAVGWQITRHVAGGVVAMVLGALWGLAGYFITRD